MAQEKTVDFSVIKQKIIKTDEILHMYLETSNKLKKVQHAFKEIKIKYDQANLNISRLQLENERCVFSLENMKLNYDRLENQNKELREQTILLEAKYNQQTIQSQLDLKKLENDMKLLQEVKVTANVKSKRKQHCGDGENDKKKKEEKLNEIKESENNYKKQIEELNIKNEKLTCDLLTSKEKYSGTIKKLGIENNDLLEKLKKTQTHSNHKDAIKNISDENDVKINELKEKLSNVEDENEGLKQKLMDQEMFLFREKSISDICVQTYPSPKKEIQTIHVQTSGSVKTYQSQKLPGIDNDKIKQLIIDHKVRDKEVTELRKNISNLMENKNKLKNVEEENEKLKQRLMEVTVINAGKKKSTSDISVQTNVVSKNHTRTVHIQTLDSVKKYQLQEESHCSEINKLRQSISDYETEIRTLRAKLQINKKNCCTQTESSELDETESVDEILKEMCVPLPQLLSPIRPRSSGIISGNNTTAPVSINVVNTSLTSMITDIPAVILTPPIPTVENKNLNFHKNESNALQNEYINNQTEKVKSTNNEYLKNPTSHNKTGYFKRIPKRRKYRSPLIGSEFVKLRTAYRYPIILNRHMLRKEIRKVEKNGNQDSILKALRTLKQSKINFTISNEPTSLPKCWSNNEWLNNYAVTCPDLHSSQIVNQVNSMYETAPQHRETKITQKLSCGSKYCNKNNSYMLLNNHENELELLGFFCIKKENFTSNSRVQSSLESKPSFLQANLNPILNNASQLTSEGLLETLAELVSKKLKEMEHLKQKRTTLMNNYDSLNSETETEIERLFVNPKYNILRRNKILLKKAQQQKRCQSESTTSYEERDIDSRKNEDTNNRTSETASSCLSNIAEEIKSRKNMGMHIYEAQDILHNKPDNENVSEKCIQVSEGQEDSCDSFKYSLCPELLSPLSIVSNGIKTPPTKLKSLGPIESSKKSATYFDYNLSTENFTCRSGMNSSDLPQTEKKICEPKTTIKTSQASCIKQNFENLTLSDSFSLQLTENVGNCLNNSPISSAIYTYLSNDTAMSADLTMLLENFEKNKSFTEDDKDIEGKDSVNESLHLKSLLSEEESPIKLKQSVINLKNKSIDSGYSSVNLLKKCGLEDKLSSELHDGTTVNILHLQNSDASKRQTIKNTFVENNEKSYLVDIQSETSIEVLPKEHELYSEVDGNKSASALDLENVSTSPDSPVHNKADFINPIIIPFEKLDDTTDNIQKNKSNDIPFCLKSSELDNLKISSTSFNKNQKENTAVVNNLDCYFNKDICGNPKLSIKEESLVSISDKNELNTEVFTCNENKHKYIPVAIAESVTKGTPEVLDRDDAIENLNKINNTEVTTVWQDISGSENLSSHLQNENISVNPVNFTVEEHNEMKSVSISSSKGNDTFPCDSVQKVTCNRNELVNDITLQISDVLLIEKNAEKVTSCPESPINDYSDAQDFTIPKIIPLENLSIENKTNNFSASQKVPSVMSVFNNQQNKDSENILLKLGDINRTQDNNEVRLQNRKRKLSTAPVVLRRSKRKNKGNKNISELVSKHGLSENNKSYEINEDHDSLEIQGNHVFVMNDIRVNEDEFKLCDSQNMKNIENTVKKKRGRPRKQPVEEEKPSKNDETNCIKVDRLEEIYLEEDKCCNSKPIENEITDTYEKLSPRNSESSISSIERANAKIQPNITFENIRANESDSQNSITTQTDSLIAKSKFEEQQSDEHEKKIVKRCGVKRKNMSKLKLNILRQFKEKRKMFQTNAEIVNYVNNMSACDSKSNSGLNESNIDIKQTDIGMCSLHICDTELKCNKKIHIVQNILIPPNSNYAVDLLKEEKCVKYELRSNCDIRLDIPQSPSQSNENVKKLCPQKNKKEVSGKDDSDIPLKKKKIGLAKSANENSDILSKIIEEMNKDRPNVLLNSEKKLNKENGPHSISDKEWRKNIITIAENIHNISTDEPDVIKQTLVQNKNMPSKKIKILMSRLLKLSTDEKIADEIILEFKRHTVDNIAEIILHKVSQDIFDKVDDKYYPAPLMTNTQRILLSLMVRLEMENVENLMDTFLSKSELFLFKIGCGIRTMVPVTRLYIAVCRLWANVNRMRMFCCHAFLFMGDLAIPLLFTVLTSWIEILPSESNLKYFPLAKVLVQIVHLKGCNKPGYNLLPLRALLNQFYGYPKERWNCDEVFEELFHNFLRNPVKSSELALRLLCKNKDTKWIYKKVNESLKPLVYKIPSENINFKATVIILIGKICKQFKPQKELDENYLNDLRRWLCGLIEGEKIPDLVEKSVNLSLSLLPKKKLKTKKAKNHRKKINTVTNAIANKKKHKRVKRLKRKK